ncbi:MAG: sialidase family protein, partial [Planctomycetota bacterium]
PDVADIFITGSPTFLQKVEMGEDRYTSGNSDKYSSVMSFFQSGISFDQPTVRIADATAVQSKVTRFKNSTLPAYQFTPTAIAPDGGSLSSPKCSAVQLEFYVKNGVGMVRIDPNCTVQLHSAGTYDYNIVSGSNPMSFQQYKIYAYHFKKTSDPCIAVPLTSTYVTQTIGGYTSAPGGQIYVNGNVVIGGGEDANFTDMNNMVVRGTMTVVATGNIWIADSIWVDDNDSSGNHYQRDANGMPPANNPNVLGLIAQGVIKIVDPGLAGSTSPTPPANYTYRRIGIKKSGSTNRYLPDPTVVEAAMTVGGGGWGAENVGGRLMYSGSSDVLYVHGSITEVIRGVVNVGDPITNGYAKNYYIDTRLMSGILPGDIWLSGKYFPAPAGWHDNSGARFNAHAVDRFFHSDDEGRNWHEAPARLDVAAAVHAGLQEPGVVELEDGQVLGWARTDSGAQYSFTSTDHGLNWSAPKPGELKSPLSPASIKRLTNQKLLAVFNDHSGQFEFVKNKRTPLVSAISTDGGRTWTNRKLLEGDKDGWYCYTAIHFVADYILLAYCAGDSKVGGLNRLRIRRLKRAWLE